MPRNYNVNDDESAIDNDEDMMNEDEDLYKDSNDENFSDCSSFTYKQRKNSRIFHKNNCSRDTLNDVSY